MPSSEWLRKHSEWVLNRRYHSRNLTNNNGGPNRLWVLGTLRCSQVRNRGKTGLNQFLIYIDLFFPTLTLIFFFDPL
jgi:hypothetical protein